MVFNNGFMRANFWLLTERKPAGTTVIKVFAINCKNFDVRGESYVVQESLCAKERPLALKYPG